MGKQFLTYEQQVFNLTQNKGLIIDDEEKAISVLKSNNYIRLHIYFQQFSENNRFIEGTTLDQILSAYEQDRSLRRLVSYYLETIEIKARSLVGHELGRAYGPDAFYDCSNFKNAVEWEKLNNQFTNASIRDESDAIENHIRNRPNGESEIWVVVEYLSFGDLSRLFGICDTRIQALIASSFGVHETLLKSWLEALSILRNVCAHYGFLRDRKFHTSPAIPKKLKSDLDNNKHLYSHVLAICWLIESIERDQFIDQLHTLKPDFDKYGFPGNWEKYLY